MNEATKILPKIKKYLNGVVYDMGCHNEKVTESAIGIDGNDFPCVKYIFDFNKPLNLMEIYPDDRPDVIFSSHLLEHLINPLRFIEECCFLLKDDGCLILYLPDTRHYKGDPENTEHLHVFYYENFIRWFNITFKKWFKIVEHGHDCDEHDHYGFWLVATKIL